MLTNQVILSKGELHFMRIAVAVKGHCERPPSAGSVIRLELVITAPSIHSDGEMPY